MSVATYVVFLFPLAMSIVAEVIFFLGEFGWFTRTSVAVLVIASVVLQIVPVCRRMSIFLVRLFLQLFVCGRWYFAAQLEQKGDVMPQTGAADRKLKKVLKEALTETLHEQRELLQDIFAEVLDEITLAEAIREGQKTHRATREEVFQILQGQP